MEKWLKGDLVRCISAGKFSLLGPRGPQKGQLLRVIDVVSVEKETASLLFEQWPRPYPAQRFSKITLDEQRALAAEFVSQINREVAGVATS